MISTNIEFEFNNVECKEFEDAIGNLILIKKLDKTYQIMC